MPTACISAPSRAPESFWFLDAHCRVVLGAAENVDGLSILELILPFDSAPPFHMHHDQDEVLHVVDGRIRIQIGRRIQEVGVGEVVHAPQGVPHGFRVVSPDGARLMVTTRGFGFEGMVRAMARPADAARVPDGGVTPEMAAGLQAACEVARISLLGPPVA